MTLYRADPKDGVAWITGASTGIGRQVAIDLARKGYKVIATASHANKFEGIEDETKGLPGSVVPLVCDVTDEAAMDRMVSRIEREHGAIALAIFNAGVYFPTNGERLEVYNFTSTFDVNLRGVINGLVPVADRMRERGHGHIVVVGSVTSYMGLPSAAAYGASKAALNSIAQSLRYDFEHLNIRIQVVNPGFVATPLTDRNKFEMPAIMPVEKASQRMLKGFASGGFEITFPRRLSWPLKLVSMLPMNLGHRIIRRATGWDERRPAFRRKRK